MAKGGLIGLAVVAAAAAGSAAVWWWVRRNRIPIIEVEIRDDIPAPIIHVEIPDDAPAIIEVEEVPNLIGTNASRDDLTGDRYKSLLEWIDTMDESDLKTSDLALESGK